MHCMFCNAKKFNSNINTWDVSCLRDMGYMFCDAHAFNGNIPNWNIQPATRYHAIFRHVTRYNWNLHTMGTQEITWRRPPHDEYTDRNLVCKVVRKIYQVHFYNCTLASTKVESHHSFQEIGNWIAQ